MRTSPVWLLLFTVTAYGAGLFAGFFLDDFAIFSSPVLTSFSGLWEVWRPEQTRPLTFFTFWINYQLGGRNPIGYHAVNLALHLGSVVVAFEALRRLMPERSAFAAAAIFAVHPLQSEAVNYIFARSTLLMAFFCLLSLNDWLRGRHWRAVVWFGVALLAKEEAVAWPVFLALLHLTISRNAAEWRLIFAMFGLAVVFGVRVLFATAVTPGSGAGPYAGISTWDYFWTQGLVIWSYVAAFIAPVLPYRMDSLVAPGMYWWAWLAVLVGVVAGIARLHGARSGFWLLAAFVLVLPSSSIFPAQDIAADRRMYLPVLALSAAVATLVPRSVYVVALLIPLAASRTFDWLDAERFWRKQASSGSVRSLVQLARVAPSSEAAEILERAKGKSPDDPLIASELGRVYLTAGAPEKALAEFGRALALTPANAQSLSNRGVALLMMKQPEAARMDFERALKIDPCAFEPRLNAMRMGIELPAAAGCRFTVAEEKALKGE